MSGVAEEPDVRMVIHRSRFTANGWPAALAPRAYHPGANPRIISHRQRHVFVVTFEVVF